MKHPTDELVTLTLWGEENQKLYEQTIALRHSLEIQFPGHVKIKRLRLAYHEELKPLCQNPDCARVVTKMVPGPIPGFRAWNDLCDECDDRREQGGGCCGVCGVTG